MSFDNPLVDLDVERAVLGGILLDNEALLLVNAVITASDFSDPVHQLLFEVFTELDCRGCPIDIRTVAAELRVRERINTARGAQYLGELTDEVPTVAHIVAHARIVADLAARRRIRDEARMIAVRAADGNISVEAVIDKGMETLTLAARNIQGLTSHRSVGDVLNELANSVVARRRHGFSLPWPTLDRALRGLRGGRLHIVAGLTSMGKSTLARNIATALAAPNAWFNPIANDNTRFDHDAVKTVVPVLFFCLEMSVMENSVQAMAACIGVSGDSIERGLLTSAKISEYMRVRAIFNQCPLRFDDEAESVARICAVARRFKREHGPCVVIVDYLQLCDAAGLTHEREPTRERQVASMSRAFKRLAMRLDVPVIVLSQLSRRGDRDDECPRLSDLRDSGALEQDADVVIFLWGRRPQGHDPTQEVNCTIAKQRGGPSGVTIPLILHRAPTRFEEAPGAAVALPVGDYSQNDPELVQDHSLNDGAGRCPT